MASEGPTTTGSINAKIGATITELEEKVTAAKALVKDLTGQKTNVKVGADVSDAVAKLTAVEAAQQKLGLATDRLKLSYQRLDEVQATGTAKQSTLMAAHLAAARAEQAHERAVRDLAAAQVEEAAASEAETDATQKFGESMDDLRPRTVAIAGGIAALVTLLGPLAATAAAAGGGFVGLGSAGVLAVLGIKKEMQDGTRVGNQYAAGLEQLQGNLGDLEHTAADEFLRSFQRVEQDVTAAMPQLNSEVAQFTAILGDATETALPAIIDALRIMNPLFVEGANFIDGLAHSFSNWVSQGGLQEFVSYSEREFPIVLQAVKAISGAIVTLGTDLTSSGNAILRVATTVSDLIQLTSQYSTQLNRLEANTKTGTAATDGLVKGIIGAFNPMQDLNSVLDGLNWVLGQVTGANDQAAAATKKHTDALERQHDEAAVGAAALGVSVTAYQNATDAQKQTEQQLRATTLQMQLEGDAAGLLKQSLDLLNGKTLDSAQAQNQFDSQLANMSDHFDQTGKFIDRANALLTGNTAAAAKNRGELISLTQAAEQNAEAFRDNGGSAEDTKQKLIDMKQAIIDNAVAHGEDREQVQQFIDTIFKIPDTIPPTKLEVDDAEATAKLQAYARLLDQVGSREVVNNVRVGNGLLPIGPRVATGGSIGHFADGGTSGTVFGGGSSTSDSVPAWLSVGEEVTNASAAKYPGVRPLLKSLNYDPAGTMAALSAPSVSKHYTYPTTMIVAADPSQAFSDFQRKQNLQAQ